MTKQNYVNLEIEPGANDTFEALQRQHWKDKEQKRLSRKAEHQKRAKARQIVEQGKQRWGVTGWTKKGKDGTTHYKCYGRGTASPWLKRRSNKAVRKSLNVANGNAYRKEFDYWWELF